VLPPSGGQSSKQLSSADPRSRVSDTPPSDACSHPLRANSGEVRTRCRLGTGAAVTFLRSLADLVPPVTVAEIELAEPVTVRYQSVAASDESVHVPRAFVLARLHGIPAGVIVVDAPGGEVAASSCARVAWESLGPDLRALSRPDQDRTVEEPPISVVVATRERPDRLAACLDSLARMEYPNFEVLVVDNDPVTDATFRLVAERRESNVRYAREYRRGLAAAHNCGLQHVDGIIAAFTDDDVTVDQKWLTEVARAFQADPDVACVTGLILPSELQTQAQLMLEAHGHFSKGFQQRVVDRNRRRPPDPLFPFTTGQLGSGANMSFHRDTLRALGGFDPATGAGTFAHGGDDLTAFLSVLVAGYCLVYQPTALVWHCHRRDLASLRGQAYGYGVGLGAYLTSALTSHPALVWQALRRAPAGLVYAFHPASPRNTQRGDAWPLELTRLERRGIAFGPVAYGVSRWRSWAARRPRSGGRWSP
jgi:GT2 family glycosyltransferase